MQTTWYPEGVLVCVSHKKLSEYLAISQMNWSMEVQTNIL